ANLALDRREVGIAKVAEQRCIIRGIDVATDPNGAVADETGLSGPFAANVAHDLVVAGQDHIRNELLVGCISLSPRALQKSRRAGREELAQVSLRVEGKPLKRPDAFENGAFDDQDLFVRWHAVLRRVSRRTANGVPLTGPPLQSGLVNRLGKCLPG